MSLPHAILTALLEKPSSGLELTRRFDKSIGYFWSATHQQIYRELGRLEREGTSGPCPRRRRRAVRRRSTRYCPRAAPNWPAGPPRARTPNRCATRCSCACAPPPSSAPTASRPTCAAISTCTGGSWRSTRRSRSGTSRPASTPSRTACNTSCCARASIWRLSGRAGSNRPWRNSASTSPSLRSPPPGPSPPARAVVASDRWRSG